MIFFKHRPAVIERPLLLPYKSKKIYLIFFFTQL